MSWYCIADVTNFCLIMTHPTVVIACVHGMLFTDVIRGVLVLLLEHFVLLLPLFLLFFTPIIQPLSPIPSDRVAIGVTA